MKAAVKTLGVAEEPCNGGSIFLGPNGKLAWSPEEHFSSALGFVVAWELAAHPWDAWPLDRVLPVHRRQGPPRPRRFYNAQ